MSRYYYNIDDGVMFKTGIYCTDELNTKMVYGSDRVWREDDDGIVSLLKYSKTVDFNEWEEKVEKVNLQEFFWIKLQAKKI